MIEDRDQDFFLKNKGIFAGLPDDRIKYYGELITSKRIHTEDRRVVWEYFDTIIAIAEKYKKEQ